MDRLYRTWATPYYLSSPNLGIILFALPTLPVQARKVLLAFTRVRQRVSVHTRFATTFAEQLQKAYLFSISTGHGEVTMLMTVKEMLRGIEDIRLDPIAMSFLSTNIRTAPYEDYTSVNETKEETIWKELQASLHTPWNASLDYSSILSPDPNHRGRRLHPTLALNPLVNRQLHSAFMASRYALQGSLCFPVMSDKTIGVEGSERASWAISRGGDELIEMREIKTLEDIERWYHLTGVKEPGVVEMRSAWKYNDLKPRVYYAQGPTVFHVSKYIQPVFNTILDFFEVVHRHNRYERPAGSMDNIDDRLVTYDYSSFTSSLDEIRSFTRALAEFYKGVEVVIVDSHRGLVRKNLGAILMEYTEICNEEPDFDIRKILELEEHFSLRHTCGMLGVPGNISSCTLLHGLHLVIALGDIYLGRCVGDDALAIVKHGSDREVWEAFQTCIQNLGQVAESKFEYWDYEDLPDTTGGAYVKRPLQRLESGILHGISLVWPSIQDIIGLHDKYHTVIKPFDRDIIKTFISQWSRLLTRIERLSIEITPTGRTLLHQFQNRTYKKFRLMRGGVTNPLPHVTLIAPKRMEIDEFGTGWKRLTIDHLRNRDQEIEVPRWGGITDWYAGRAGEVFQGSGSRVLGLIEKLGYVERTQLREKVNIANITCEELLEAYVTLSYPVQYKFTVLADFPIWVDDVNRAALMSPHERLSSHYSQDDTFDLEDAPIYYLYA